MFILSSHPAHSAGGGASALPRAVAPLRVVTVSDDPCFRGYLEAVLRDAASLVLVRGFDTGAAFTAALEAARRTNRTPEWDLVVVDLEADEPPALREVKEALPGVRVVALTAGGDPPAVRGLSGDGADAWVPKYTPAERLLGDLSVAAADPAANGGTTIDLTRAHRFRRAEEAAGVPPLTCRERAVLHCLVEGMSYKACARGLGISVDTVRTHIRSLYGKLEVHTAGEAVALALRDQLA